jgi:hypothetical protein
MPADSITADVTACRDRVAAAEDCRLIEVSRLPGADAIALATESLTTAADLAGDLGAPVCYLQVDRTAAGEVARAAVAFFYEGVLHTASRTSDRVETDSAAGDRDGDPVTAATPADDRAAEEPERDESAADDAPTDDDGATTDDAPNSDAPTDGVVDPDAATPEVDTDEVDDEKVAIARELLSTYGEHLGDGDKYQLTYRLASTSLPQLERMRDEAQAAAAADADAEERLARIVFRDGRFNDAYTVADTEMLLNALDVEYDTERVRLEKVHQQAMSLRTLNE